jgi:hypothetical protein
MGVATRSLDVDTRVDGGFVVVAAKDEQYRQLENRSEEKIYNLREPGSNDAPKLLVRSNRRASCFIERA